MIQRGFFTGWVHAVTAQNTTEMNNLEKKMVAERGGGESGYLLTVEDNFVRACWGLSHLAGQGEVSPRIVVYKASPPHIPDFGFLNLGSNSFFIEESFFRMPENQRIALYALELANRNQGPLQRWARTIPDNPVETSFNYGLATARANGAYALAVTIGVGLVWGIRHHNMRANNAEDAPKPGATRQMTRRRFFKESAVAAISGVLLTGVAAPILTAIQNTYGEDIEKQVGEMLPARINETVMAINAANTIIETAQRTANSEGTIFRYVPPESKPYLKNFIPEAVRGR